MKTCEVSLFFFFCAVSLYFFFFQAEDGIRDRSPSRGLGDVYKRQDEELASGMSAAKICGFTLLLNDAIDLPEGLGHREFIVCLLYTSDAADEEDSVDLGCSRIIKKKKT